MNQAEHKTTNPLDRVMQSGKRRLLNIYFTAGYPEIDSLPKVVDALQTAGVDMIEIGMPYSDPLADGPTIQMSNQKALANGMTITRLFDQLEGLRMNIPVMLMGYLNPVLQFGFERFCRRCADVGVAGLILPDLPFELYEARYRHYYEQNGLSNICLVTPQTSDQRIRSIDRACSGFIYAVSSASTTGTKISLSDVDSYLLRLSEMDLSNPIMTGFNIRDRASFERATKYVRGGIIGSAFIRLLPGSTQIQEDIIEFVNEIRP